MGTATQSISIDGHAYAVTQLPARRASRLLNRLLRDFGPALAQLVSAVDLKGKKLAEIELRGLDGARVGSALEGLFLRLTEDEQDHILNEVLSTATVDGKELLPVLDLHFQGRLGAMYRVAAFGLKVNFSDFFGGSLAAAVRAAMAANASGGSSTSPTTGSSGASSS